MSERPLSRRERRAEERQQRRLNEISQRGLSAMGQDIAASSASITEKMYSDPNFDLLAHLREAEQRHLKIGRAHLEKLDHLRGTDSLSTDTMGAKSERDFASSGRPFSLGVASTCVVVGIVHPEIGIAGSHRNTMTVEDSAAAFKKTMDNPVLRQVLSLADPITQLNFTSKPETRRRLAQQAASEAAEQFGLLAFGQIPSSGWEIYSYGIFYIPRDEIPLLDQLIVSTVVNHPAMQLQETHRSGLIIPRGRLGNAGELIYGGKNHEIFPTPTFDGIEDNSLQTIEELFPNLLNR